MFAFQRDVSGGPADTPPWALSLAGAVLKRFTKYPSNLEITHVQHSLSCRGTGEPEALQKNPWPFPGPLGWRGGLSICGPLPQGPGLKGTQAVGRGPQLVVTAWVPGLTPNSVTGRNDLTTWPQFPHL